MNIEQLYQENNLVKNYIDRYASKHNISISEAMKHQQVALYVQWLVEKNIL